MVLQHCFTYCFKIHLRYFYIWDIDGFFINESDAFAYPFSHSTKPMKKIRTPFFLSVTFLFALGCNTSTSQKNYVLTAREKTICDSLQLDSSIVIDIRNLNTSKIEPFHYSLSKIYSQGSAIEANPIFLTGIVLTEKNAKSYDLIISLKDKLKSKGYSIFLLENNFNYNNSPDIIGVIKTTDQYSVLSQVATDGINYDITNDSLISIIKNFDKKYALELIGASGDWCEFIIHNEPKSWLEFANEVYEVCPDVVDQGTGTVEALADEMQKSKRLYFWWD